LGPNRLAHTRKDIAVTIKFSTYFKAYWISALTYGCGRGSGGWFAARWLSLGRLLSFWWRTQIGWRYAQIAHITLFGSSCKRQKWRKSTKCHGKVLWRSLQSIYGWCGCGCL